MRIAVVILAGGEGTRMGGCKPLRLLAGVPLIERALDRASGFSDDVAVAIREPSQLGATEAHIILDDPAIEGPLAGLVAGLRFARDANSDALLTLPADMPFLPHDLAARMRSALLGNEAAIASSGGHLHPVCGLWGRSCLDFIPDYLNSGRRSLKGFAEMIGYIAVEWDAKPQDPFFNINTAKDLEAAERWLNA